MVPQLCLRRGLPQTSARQILVWQRWKRKGSVPQSNMKLSIATAPGSAMHYIDPLYDSFAMQTSQLLVVPIMPQFAQTLPCSMPTLSYP